MSGPFRLTRTRGGSDTITVEQPNNYIHSRPVEFAMSHSIIDCAIWASKQRIIEMIETCWLVNNHLSSTFGSSMQLGILDDFVAAAHFINVFIWCWEWGLAEMVRRVIFTSHEWMAERQIWLKNVWVCHQRVHFRTDTIPYAIKKIVQSVSRNVQATIYSPLTHNLSIYLLIGSIASMSSSAASISVIMCLVYRLHTTWSDCSTYLARWPTITTNNRDLLWFLCQWKPLHLAKHMLLYRIGFPCIATWSNKLLCKFFPSCVQARGTN